MNTTNANIIKVINSKIVELTPDEISTVNSYLEFHECEASAAAERISEFLEVSYESIYELL